jgi:hypothetical protein
MKRDPTADRTKCDQCGTPFGFVNCPISLKQGKLAGKWIGLICCAKLVFEETSWRIQQEFRN